jgi:hypothetical protein
VADYKTPFYTVYYFFLRLGEVIMKAVKGNLFAVEIKGKLNTTNRSRDQWAQIVDCRSGKVLHTGQPRYIKRVAKAKYNTLLDI